MSPDLPVRPTANRSSRAAAARAAAARAAAARGSAPTTVPQPGRPAARRARPAILLAFAVLLVAGCSTGSSGAAGASSAPTEGPTATRSAPTPVTPAQATVAPAASEAPSAAPADPSSAAPSSPAGPATITSPFYAYSLTFPASGWSPQPAPTRWDGEARIDSNGPLVDRATGPGSKLLFVYGAPTDLDLAAWSAKGQADVNRWHGCPATAESEADITIGGTPGRLHAFHCNNLYVMKAFAVRDGFGWAFNQLSPPGQEPADTAALSAMLTEVDFTK